MNIVLPISFLWSLQLSVTEIIFIVIFILAYIDQIFIYSLYKVRLKPYFNESYNLKTKPVSVIISAKNEAENLRKFLVKILRQDHPNFEVIVINDGSNDNTSEVLKDYQKIFSNLKIIDLEKSVGKKDALTIAIKESNNPFLVFTDADCYPETDKWLRIISGKFTDKKQIILGYGPYEYRSGFVNGLIRYETYMIALQYITAASLGKPYMGVGRNMAYTKNIWVKSDGFESHNDILSGDDDLFISQNADSKNTGICLNDGSFTYSVPKNNFFDLIKQKCRHLSTSSKYNLWNLFFSGGEIISRYFLFISAIVLVCFKNIAFIILCFLLARICFIYIICYANSKKLKTKIKFHSYIIFDIFVLIYYFGVFAYKFFFYNSKKW